MYAFIFRHFFRRLDPELAHRLAFVVIQVLGWPVLRTITAAILAPDRSLAVNTLGLRFPTPFGVAAGFDKEAGAVIGLGALGFGHVEIGTVTARAQPGNPKPRLFRLVPDRALINRMGFNNHGAAAVAPKLAAIRRVRHRPVVGANIGKSRVVEVDDAIDDYLLSTRALAHLADFVAVNVSSPNTPGLRGLQELDLLEPLLSAVKDAAGRVPVLVKIAPDLDDDAVTRIARLVDRIGLAGLIATNTTLSREGLSTDQRTIQAAGAGGLSGLPLAHRALEVLRVARAALPPQRCLIAVGGVETAEDVQLRLDAGADLVQGYTGFIYRGPLWAHEINRGLVRIRRARAQAGN